MFRCSAPSCRCLTPCDAFCAATEERPEYDPAEDIFPEALAQVRALGFEDTARAMAGGCAVDVVLATLDTERAEVGADLCEVGFGEALAAIRYAAAEVPGQFGDAASLPARTAYRATLGDIDAIPF